MVSLVYGMAFYVPHGCVYTGMNICPLIQLSRAYKVARLWANIVTFVTFILASASLSLISYVTIVGSIDHCNAPEGPVAWFSGHKFTSIWFATNSTTLMAVWILDSCVVRTSTISAISRLIFLQLTALPVLYYLLGSKNRVMGNWLSSSSFPVILW